MNHLRRNQLTLWFSGCNKNINIPPATETLRDSNSPAIGMLISSQDCLLSFERPAPSLPKTKHNGKSATESAKSWESLCTLLEFLSSAGWPANIFIWNNFLRDSTWVQLPETIGIWKEAPREALSAFSLNGSQQPGSRKTPPCWIDKTFT